MNSANFTPCTASTCECMLTSSSSSTLSAFSPCAAISLLNFVGYFLSRIRYFTRNKHDSKWLCSGCYATWMESLALDLFIVSLLAFVTFPSILLILSWN